MFAVPPPPSDTLQPRRSASAAAAPFSSSTSTQAAAHPRLQELDSAALANENDNAEEPIWSYLRRNPTALLTDHERCFDLVAGAVLAGEVVLCAAVVRYVPYTEIDFSTYLQQAQAFMDGERDYSLLKGESGPANYPALHIYLYSFLSYLTDRGAHLKRAQWAFAGVYLVTMAVVLWGIYRRNRKIPPYVLPLLSISKRLHSIYMLRMFNDCLVMLLVYSAIALYMVPAGVLEEGRKGEGREAKKRRVERRWLFGTLLLSCALSIKMSTLLFLPALFYLTFVHFSPLFLLQNLLVLLSSQLVLSLPFLLTHQNRLTYLSQAFDFKRSFEWEFTVNWRWLGDEDLFLDPRWKRGLLVAQVVGLGVWAVKWAEEDGGRVERLLSRAARKPAERPARGRKLTSSRIATVFFCSNLTGIVCARSLHPQFYAWFAHQLVWMCFGTGIAFDPMHCLVLISLVEYGFSVWPSTVNSSLGLVMSLLILLFGVYYAPRPADIDEEGDVVVPAEWTRIKDT
ncbi:hypothetical protein JCM10908_003586 [Rhodotorula pacifica]|uniref:dolichyl-P-Man:Man(5)GlcNAc(2)-PP-dolichol alpha-1,3-mannosyltransferase n=1 Tax=Rhodotorula pacifica TaxID=1495444 RepID=UPI003172941F